MLDDNTGMYYSKGKIISLTPTENLILQVLIRNKQRATTYKEILHEVWLMEYNKKTRLMLEQRISLLRYKLRKVLKITTIRTIGYNIREV